jgi:hypothetical protein
VAKYLAINLEDHEFDWIPPSEVSALQCRVRAVVHGVVLYFLCVLLVGFVSFAVV